MLAVSPEDPILFIDQLNTAGALPTLEATMRFSAKRQQLIAHNIANLETPNFTPVDVDPRHFQSVLRDAVDERRGRARGTFGPIDMDETRQLEQRADGGLTLRPLTHSGNIAFHDRNNRDLERTMQQLAENAAAFRLASDLMKNRTGVLRSAISERIA